MEKTIYYRIQALKAKHAAKQLALLFILLVVIQSAYELPSGIKVLTAFSTVGVILACLISFVRFIQHDSDYQTEIENE